MTVTQWLELMQSCDSDVRRIVAITEKLVDTIAAANDVTAVFEIVSALLTADRIFQLRGKQ